MQKNLTNAYFYVKWKIHSEYLNNKRGFHLMKYSTETPAPIFSALFKGVLLLIDWDNFFYSLFSRFGAGEMRIEFRIEWLMRQIREEIGELLGGYGIVFAPEHINFLEQQIFVRHKLRLMVCPKRNLIAPKIDPKTGDLITIEDTVDESILWFAKIMLKHPNFKFLCLVAGDNDYVPLFKEVARYGIKRALIAPTIDCLAKSKELINLVDKHPKSLKKMSFRLDDI